MAIWSLYVDESGNFARRGDAVAVAGVLIREDLRGNRPVELRQSLVRAVAGMPWPLHASALNFTAYIGLTIWRSLGRQQSPLWWEPPPPKIRIAAERCVETLRKAKQYKQVLASVMEQIGRGREPSHNVLERLTEVLEEKDPESHYELFQHGLNAWAAVGRLLGQLASAGGSGAAPPAALAVSSETWRGDAATDKTGGPRYITLLRCLLDRVGDTLARLALPGIQEVNLNVLKRSGPAPFNRTDLANIVADYRGRWPNKVTLRIKAVVGFGGDVDPGYVLADFVAHRTRPILNEVHSTLEEIEKEIRDNLAAPVRSGAPGRSHLAASGAAQRLLEAARAQSAAVTPCRGRCWACAQAREWAGAAV